MAALKPVPETQRDLCDYNTYPAGCYLGWIDSYNTADNQRVGKESELLPVFTINGVSERDYTIHHINEIEDDWAHLIYLFAEKINPFKN